MAENLCDIYDELARGYDEKRSVFDMTEILNSFTKLCDADGKRLLDLGCGAGVPFAESFLNQGWQVTGVDFSHEMLRLAKVHLPKLKTVCMDMRELSFADESFEAVSAVYSLFHLSSGDQLELLKKMYNWLVVGGKALFTYATKEYTGSEEFDGYKMFFGHRLFYSHRTPETLCEELEGIGFNIIATDYREIGGETFLWVSIEKK